MHPDQIAEKLRELETWCRRMGVPLTVQRRVVLEAVLNRDDHPTTDQIIEVVKRQVPNVSRTTVYRILDMLVDVGVIRRLHHPGPVARFDGKTGRHHHLICKKCHCVIDVENAKLNRLALPDVGEEGFQIDDYSVHFVGTCAACRRAKSQ
jgi:Fur family peroxide stress response transcriptional regulator